jgi:hypothetical protein
VKEQTIPRIRQRLLTSAPEWVDEVTVPDGMSLAFESRPSGDPPIQEVPIQRSPGGPGRFRGAVRDTGGPSRGGPGGGRWLRRIRGAPTRLSVTRRRRRRALPPERQRMKPHWRASNGKHSFETRRVGFRTRWRSSRPWLEHARRVGRFRVRKRGDDLGWSWIDRELPRWADISASHGQEERWPWPLWVRGRAAAAPIEWGMRVVPRLSTGPGFSRDRGFHRSTVFPITRAPNFEGMGPRITPSPWPWVVEEGLRQPPVVGEEV